MTQYCTAASSPRAIRPEDYSRANRVDGLQLARALGIDWPDGKKKIRSPLRDDRNPSFRVYLKDGRSRFRDWGCGGDFSCVDFAAAVLKVEPAEAVKFIFDRFNLGESTPRTTTPPAKAQHRQHPGFAAIDDLVAHLEQSLRGVETRRDFYTAEFAIIRIDPADKPKQYRPASLINDKWHIQDPPGPLPLLHVDEIVNASEVSVHEGEKSAEAARSIGMTATTSAHGAMAAAKSDWSPLAGKTVCIFPDGNEAGEGYCSDVISELAKLSAKPKIKVIRLPGLPDGGDIADYIEAHDSVENEAISAQIRGFIDAAPWVKARPDVGDTLPDVPKQWMTLRDVMTSSQYKSGVPVVSSGFAAIDDQLGGGFRAGFHYLIAAITGGAKSTLLANIARLVALDGTCTLFVTLEDPPTIAMYRIHAAVSSVPWHDFLNGLNGHGNAIDAAREAFEILADLPLRISAERDIEAVERVIGEHMRHDGKLVLVDQLSKVKVPDSQNEYLRISAISEGVRVLADRYKIPIVVAAQVNRLASREGKPLAIHDLRDSGMLEQDAAGVLLIDRPEDAGGGSLWLPVRVGKHRFGRLPDDPIRLVWHPRIARIDDPGRAG